MLAVMIERDVRDAGIPGAFLAQRLAVTRAQQVLRWLMAFPLGSTSETLTRKSVSGTSSAIQATNLIQPLILVALVNGAE